MLPILIHALVFGIKAATKAADASGTPGDGTEKELAGAVAHLTAREREVGSSHPSLLQPLGALASLRAERGEWDQALPLLRRATEIIESTPLAELESVGGPGRSQWILERCVQLSSRRGANHPTVATSLLSLAEFRIRQGRLADAERELERAMQIEQLAFGPDHHRVAGVLEKLGRVVAVQDRHREALPLWSRALAIREKERGADDPGLVTALCGLAHTFQALSMIDEAEASLWRAIALKKKELGAEHAEVQALMDALGALYLTA